MVNVSLIAQQLYNNMIKCMVIYLKLRTEKIIIFLPVRSFRNKDLDKKSLFEILE